MSLNTEENRKRIITLFPGLATDNQFVVTSPIDKKYNCIAYAANKTDKWWWPAIEDGVYWPLDNHDMLFPNLILAFETIGYRVCETWEFEEKYKKIALYIDEDGEFTHAARQMRSGVWTSKLGEVFDIFHGNPYTIEGDAYGKVGAFMSIIF